MLKETPTSEAGEVSRVQAVQVAEVRSSGSTRADRIMCSEITSMRDEQDGQDETANTYPFRLKEEGRKRPEQDSESLESEQQRVSSAELSSARQSTEDLRAEFEEGLRVQQEMFRNTGAELQALQAELGAQRETFADAWAVFESSMASMQQ